MQNKVIQLHNSFLKKSIYIGQMLKIFLFFFNRKQIVIIDQHAAHEQILFEKFVCYYDDCKLRKKYIYLDTPINIKLSIKTYIIIRKYIKSIINIGIKIVFNKSLSFTLYSYLKCYKLDFIKKLPKIFISIYEKNIYDKIFEINFLKIYFQSQACRKSIKLGYKISSSQALYIKYELNKLANNSFCPHGRPIMKVISIENLMKNFFRYIKK